MAINPTVTWRVRKSGNNANGGGFDSSISGSGTDYSQQDSAQLTLTDIACSNNTTITSAVGGFTSAMIGNAIWLTGGGSIADAYFITARGSTNSVTIDRAPGTISGGNGKVGGGWADPWTNLASVQPGNTVYIRGTGTAKPTTDDYARTGFVQVTGDLTNGLIRFIGENGKPRLASNGLMFFNKSYLWFEGIYFSTNGTNYASYGILNIPQSSPTGCTYLIDCVLDQNGFDCTAASGSWTIIRCEVFSRTGGSGSSYALDGNSFGMQIIASNIHNTTAHGIRFSNHLGNHISDSIIAKCNGDGLTWDSSAQGTDAGSNSCINVTIDANLGDGIHFNGANGLQEATILNCIISNHTGSGKYGMNVGFGSTAVNDAIKGYIDFNAFYGNTTDVHLISKGANDITGTDPQYSAQSTQGYGIGQNLKAKGYPQSQYKNSSTLFTPTATQAYVDIGGVQRLEGAA